MCIKGYLNIYTAAIAGIKRIVEKQSEELCNIRAINSELNAQLMEKDIQYKAICDQYNQLNEEHIKLVNMGATASGESRRQKTLLIGSSLVRDIQSNDSSVFEVRKKSGATLPELTDDLDGINQVFDHIIVVGGGNDCSKKDTTTTEISASMAILLAKANEKAINVRVASVLPRPREPEIQIKMDHVNDSIKKLCKEKPAYNFVNNDGAFKLSDLSPNEAFYTEDGVHISYHGSQKLVSNLGIKDMCYIKKP